MGASQRVFSIVIMTWGVVSGWQYRSQTPSGRHDHELEIAGGRQHTTEIPGAADRLTRLRSICRRFVVPKSGGGYQTIDTQRGSVTAVSATSITVKSADGFVKTYQVVSSTYVDAQRDGIAAVKIGHQVAVTATVGGSTAPAVSILDFNLLPAMHGPGWNHPAPSAAPTTGMG